MQVNDSADVVMTLSPLSEFPVFLTPHPPTAPRCALLVHVIHVY